jgi:uncharacterized membrane protein
MNAAQTPEPGKDSSPIHMTLAARLRAYFFAGVLVTAPIAITFFVAWTFIEVVDGWVMSMVPPTYRFDMPFPGVGLLLLVVMLMAIGAFAAGFLGRLLVRTGESLLQRVPVIRNIYGALKQIIETILAQQSSAFRQVVLVEYPRRNIWAIAFITGVTEGEVQNLTESETVNVFLPTTPNPTSGFLLFVPREDLIVLDMSVEEGIKMVISGGIVTPPDRRAAEVRKMPLVTGGEDVPEVSKRRKVAPKAETGVAPIRIEESEPPRHARTDTEES